MLDSWFCATAFFAYLPPLFFRIEREGDAYALNALEITLYNEIFYAYSEQIFVPRCTFSAIAALCGHIF